MRRICFIITLLLIGSRVFSQQNDYGKVWVNGSGISFKTTFQGNQVINQLFDTVYSPYFHHGHSNICDSTGNLLLCSDGFNVYNSTPELIDGGDTLIPNNLYIQEEGWSMYPQTSIFLPMSDNKYYFITPVISDSFFNAIINTNDTGWFDLLLYNVVDMNANGGVGKVIRRMVPAAKNAKMCVSQMMACRHGDGKSWWLLKQGFGSANTIYKFLFTQDSVYGPLIQTFSAPDFNVLNNYGQAMFNQTGNQYATTCIQLHQVFLADFDRCTGTLSNPKVYKVPPLPINGNPAYLDSTTIGVCFSPNGRFLYVAQINNILQLDLQDTNKTTQWYHVAGADTIPQAFHKYATIYPGPDGKLYIGNYGIASLAMSVIDSPDNKGAACSFCPKCLHFPLYTWGTMEYRVVMSPPCMPNYKLGAADTPCTVGIRDPHIAAVRAVMVVPNPNNGKFRVQYELFEKETGELQITDMMGRTVQRLRLEHRRRQEVDLDGEPSGIYFYRFIVNGNVKRTGKISIVK